MAGWSGEARVEAAAYAPATPPGWLLALETHTGVLAVDGGDGPILRRNGTNVWTQAAQGPGDSPSRFFRVKAELKSE